MTSITLSPERGPVPLRQLLLEAAKKPNLVAKPSSSPAIKLGEFGWESERLLKMSLADPDHYEFANPACIDDAGRLLMLRKPIRGSPGEVCIPLSVFKNKRILLVNHSHGDIDISPSMGDLELLFANPADPSSALGVLVATLTAKILVFRTEQTPAFANTNDWIMKLQEHPALEEEQQLWLRNYKDAGGYNLEWWQPVPISEETKQEITKLSHKRMFALSRVALQCYLDIYACPLTKNIVYPVC